MSGESSTHTILVENLIRVVDLRHKHTRGFTMFADHHRFGSDRPPMIGGFTPDLFASDVPESFRIIGEAKTSSDLDSMRTHFQIRAFLEHLSLYENGMFYLAVPLFVGPRARYLLKSFLKSDGAKVIAEVFTFL
jgi:hypothetical protein